MSTAEPARTLVAPLLRGGLAVTRWFGRRLPGVALFVAVFSAIMFTTSREPAWTDAKPIYEVAESLVAGRGITVTTRWPPNLPLGKGGQVYALAPLVQSLVHWPGAKLATMITTARPELHLLMRAFGCHVGPAALGALVFMLVLALARELGVSRPARAWGAVAALFGSYVAIYARMPYSEILQTACFTGFFLCLWRLAHAADGRAEIARRALALGAWAGLLAATKLVFMLSIACGGVFLAWTWRARWKQLPLAAACGAVTFLPILSIVPLYNRARWQATAETGYGLAATVFQADAFGGLWGPLLSPGKSLLLFAPPLVLTVLALPRAFRRHGRLLAAIALTIFPVFWLYARFLIWSGDYAWGPRYHVFAVPVLLMPGLVVVDQVVARAGRWTRAGVTAGLGATLAAGLFMTALGSAFYWDHWIRLSRSAASAWLGRPNIAGSGTLTMPDRCGACFEELYPMQWIPTFSAAVGHVWFMRHVPAKHDYAVAELDAPWRRYTSIPIDLRLFYGRTRIDWWHREWQTVQPALADPVAWGISGTGALAFVAWALLTWRQARRRARN